MADSTFIKRDGLHSVRRIENPNGGAIARKTWPLSVQTLCKLAVGQAGAQRHIRGARRLHALGIEAVTCIGVWRVGRLEGRRVIELDSPWVAGDQPMALLRAYHAGEEDRAKLERAFVAVGTQLGRIIQRIAGAGLRHRDFKLNNVIVSWSGDEPTAHLIDHDGVQRRGNRVSNTAWMLERLAVRPLQTALAIPRAAWRATLRAAMADMSVPQRRRCMHLLRKWIKQDIAWVARHPHRYPPG